ncbi:hypothetical protein BDC45DRAFT_542526 [Circinella umbellata]|nr:hypothetical protein BDC45DRAFT_542526 [Circinella umbellata]
MHTRRTGHKRAITLSTQLSKALKNTVNESEDSSWRNEHDAVNDRGNPYLTMHQNKRAEEELAIIKNESRYTILYSAGLLIRLRALIDSLPDTEDIEKRGLVVLLRAKMTQVYNHYNQHSILLGHLVPEEEIVEVNRVITAATVASVFVESQSGIDDDCDSSEDDNDDDEDEDDGNDELETIAALLEEQVDSDTNNN